jgi:hypothetical protein
MDVSDRTPQAILEARQAYENGTPLRVLRRWFHLSDSEAREIAPEEFEDVAQADSVSGY